MGGWRSGDNQPSRFDPAIIGAMTDDERHPKSFEEAARELAGEIRDSIERYAQADPQDVARAAGVDPDRLREWVDGASEWLRSQFEVVGEPRRRSPAPDGEDILR